MGDGFVFYIFIDLFIQLALLILLWRIFRCIRRVQDKIKTNKTVRYVSQKLLLSLQIASVVVVFLLAYSVTYGSGEASFGSLLMMFGLYLAMPMHSGILVLTIAMNSMYKKIVQADIPPQST